MPRWPVSDQDARDMYRGGRGDETAKWFARWWGRVFAAGLLPRRWVTLEVVGRRSGQVRRVPLGMADVGDRWFLVSMLGEDCHWVRNVRAADGRVVVRRLGSRDCRLAEVPVAARGLILRRYVAKVPGARPHIPVAPGAKVAAFDAISDRYPVFEVFVESGEREIPYRPRPTWPVVAALATSLTVAGARRWRTGRCDA
jgi:deazaflavin-dependent oxidoreductase (nitroreductase family)